MILIHCALLSEAIYLIEKYKLTKTNSTPKIYLNDKIILIVSNIGKENTIVSLEYIFNRYTISKAYNIGIAGTIDKNIALGTLFCTNHILTDIPNLPLITVQQPQKGGKKNYLYDMEGKYFEEICLKYLGHNNIFIFKIVSDYLDGKKLSKEFVKQLIKTSNIVLKII